MSYDAVDLGEATRLYQAVLEESRGPYADEITQDELERARSNMEIAWLERAMR